jgi:hypothetical protein
VSDGGRIEPGVLTGQLTARAVRDMLTRAGVRHTALTITDDPEQCWDEETGEEIRRVRVTGPQPVRQEAWVALFRRGLACSPHLAEDYWSRRRGPR